MKNTKTINNISYKLFGGIAILIVLWLIIRAVFLGPSNQYAYIDLDKDGYPTVGENGEEIDCDDNNDTKNPEGVEIPNDGVDQDCNGSDLELVIDEKPSTDNTKIVTLYRDFIFREPVSVQSITNNSLKVQVYGELIDAKLIVKAKTTKYGYDKTRKHSVYFYIDSGLTGGHIDAIRKDNKLVGGDGVFTILTEGGLSQEYKLWKLPIGLPNGSTTLDVQTKLNDNQIHYIGAFVSTGIYGILEELSISYKCKTTECGITFKK